MTARSNKKPKRGLFLRFAKGTATATGSPYAFILASATVLVWGLTGPLFDYSDTWQLVINTGTTIITFLMVFLIQNTQNRDSMAMQLKLDELIRATEGAHTVLLDLEELSDKELRAICGKYREIAEASRKQLRQGNKDTHEPLVDLDDESNAKPKTKAHVKRKPKRVKQVGIHGLSN